ncbi:helix-turn-helix domain-containing protein [Parabacteroides pacaensis]|uniref:helix-turn-helix domain-containing protein n=1 Tax=Parabacteroides pacaensis TaxID=2086575 RepID=UPI000D110779|nr:helix-turn-helix domain-containing protein [Parabacteroides pacaensis]
MDSQEVCVRLNISLRTLQTLRDNGKLPYSQIQHKFFYKPKDVGALLTFVGLQRKE